MELFIKHPIEVQSELLEDLLLKARDTEWGRKYDYKSINNYNEYANRVPIQSYETLKPFIDRVRNGEQQVLWNSDIKWFAKSSGTTTGKSKFIPVSKETLIDCHYKGGKDLLAIYHNNHPKSKLILGKTLVVGGSSQINRLENGSYTGDLSAIIMKNFPLWVEQRRVPKLSEALMDNWEEKIAKMVKSTVYEDVSNISGVPSWTLVLLKKMLATYKKENILEIWPNLELYMHGGVNFEPYKKQFEALIPSKSFNYYQNYNASEGFFGIQNLSKVDDMLLMLDYGIFYEFIDVADIDNDNPQVIALESVELNKNYALIITTNSGLWRYMIGDTIKFTSLSPYKIKVTGRTKNFINAFGEELIIENAELAISMACKNTNAIVSEFTVAPQYFESDKSGRHEWLIEFEKEPINIEEFNNRLDIELKKINSDYEAKRFNNLVLAKPNIIKAKKGTFYKWLKEKNRLGGQHKVPRLSNNRNYMEELLKLV